jgi:hypothetical protein
MSRFGKCQNFSGCLLAYRGEETEVEDDQPFICAECGKPLTEVRSPSAVWLRYAYGLGGLVVVLGLAFALIPPLRGLIVKHKEHVEPGERQKEKSPEETPPPESPGKTDTTATTQITPPADTAPSAPPAEVPQFVTSPARIDLDVSKKENKDVKAEVLTRVDLMPNVSQNNKDKLYSAVERARSMGKIVTIPFASGKPTSLPPISRR